MNRFKNIKGATLNPAGGEKKRSPFGGLGGGFGLLLCGLAVLLFSCVLEVVPDEEEPEIQTGDLVTVKFSIGETGYGANEVATPALRSASSPTLSEEATSLPPFGGAGGGVFFPVSDEFDMYVNLTEDKTPVKLRAATEYLASGTYVRIVAYRESATPGDYSINAGYADYVVAFPDNSKIEPVDNPLMLPPDKYNFVAYSYNTTSLPSFDEITNPLDQMISNHDVLWGDTIASVILPHASVHITLKHLFARIIVVADFDPAAVITDFNLSTPSIDAFYTTLTVRTGDITKVSARERIGLSRSLISPVSGWISDTLYVYTDFANTDTTVLKFDNVTINGTTYPGPLETYYIKPVLPGRSYTLYVTFLTMFSYADILYIAADSTLQVGRWKDGVINPDNVLYFKFGGVVGFTRPVGGSTAWDTTLIRFNPLTNNANHRIIGYETQLNFNAGNPSIYTVACYQNNTHFNSSSANRWDVSNLTAYHTATNLKMGLGDPCRLVGLKSNAALRSMTGAALVAHQSDWILPWAKENVDFVRAPISWYPPPSTTGNNTIPSASLLDVNTKYWGSYNGQYGGWFPIPGERDSLIRPIRNSNPNGFLPALGGYYPGSTLTGSNPNTYYPGIFTNGGGYYWSREVAGSADGFFLMFNATSLYQLWGTGNLTSQFNRAYPVRCVKKPT